jgi:hypothetical protein
VAEEGRLSADNYNFIRRRRDGHGWDVWLNLSASAPPPDHADLGQPERTFDTLEQANQWADEQGYTEYGNEIDDAPQPSAPAEEVIARTLADMADMTPGDRRRLIRDLGRVYCEWCGEVMVPCHTSKHF